MFHKILIANRGEIAVRIIRACREMGIYTVAVYSEADRNALHVKLADEAYCIGPASARDSYLNFASIMSVATLTEADAIHPGYGFLAENSDFAELCAECRIQFIGPRPDAIQKMGDKVTAIDTMRHAGVPVIPGSDGLIDNEEEAVQTAEAIGFPIVVKATAGGGGKGIRVVRSTDELIQSLHTARKEAEANFGNAGVYLEKYLQNPRHVEVQILADRHGNVIHLGERDCSVQRRMQKLIEETPSPAVSESLREEMGQAAIRAAHAAHYEGAGTVEFLLEDGNFYFLEMNTRIQVEHPVTEMVTGIDLIKEQIRIAAGETLSVRQEDIQLNGWAIECRINAEDPEHNFLPTPGEITSYLPPGGAGIRVDSSAFPGAEIPPFYDSMIAKLIAWGNTREEAIVRMQRALAEFAVEGVATTIPFHLQVLAHERFVAGEVTTKFLDQMKKEGVE